MRIRTLSFFSAIAIATALFPVAQAPAQVADPTTSTSCSLAGYGDSDATYPVGSQAGQYSTTPDPTGDVDPHAQAVKKHVSYGVQSRLNVRAIVVKGCGANDKPVALVKDDHYLSQDAVQRRIGQILAARGSDVTYENLLVSATHNHSSPYQVTPSWGVWLFQDSFDARAFEFFARRAADAIIKAEGNLQPARMGATVVYHDIMKSNIQRYGGGHDGTPVGYPQGFGDHGVTVMRFDNAETGAPIGTWVNWGEHPESLDGYDIITADYVGAVERMVMRATGGGMVFSQGDVGSSEGPYDGDRDQGTWLPDGTRRAFAHMGYAQFERGARYLADSILDGYNEIGAGGGMSPYATDFPVAAYNGWVPMPKSHPYPGVSNCRSEPTAEGDPGAPVLGLPDCQRANDTDGLKEIWPDPDPNNMLWENLTEHGVPLPENYDAPSFGAVEENLRIRLQAVRVGDVILGSCSCEAQVDIIRNFESRADNIVGNFADGYEWQCSRPDQGTGDPKADHEWTCVNPDKPDQPWNLTFSDYDYAHMLAQVHNNAAGWDAPEYVPYANAEPDVLSQIKGNFTWEELGGTMGTPRPGATILPSEGYKIAVGLGHTGDYSGYTVSYREYMNNDTYRKALTCCGSHTADYMSTNLVYMAQALKGGEDLVKANPYNALAAVDETRQTVFTTALGQGIGQAYDAWYKALPADANPGNALTQPHNITRFDATQFSWTGGASVVDSPIVEVQRKVGENWETYADQTGEVQMFLEYPDGVNGAADLTNTYTGKHQWNWTANFEAFDFGPRRDIDPRGPQTPAGEYRFVVSGKYRKAIAGPADVTSRDATYQVASEPFTVSPFTGIKVADFRSDADGVSFTVAGPTTPDKRETFGPQPQILYPRTYLTPKPAIIRFIKDDNRKDVCKTCTFRPWAVGSDVASATVTVLRADGTIETAPATLSDDGRFHAAVALADGDEAYVATGGIVDTYGETNGAPSEIASFTETGTTTATTGDSTVDIFGGLNDLLSAWGAKLR
ncbi:MAG: hypothetical protein QOG54_1805 [Actinomycetota bacterium]|nr:hypothetical protein [Actinomycetota bacterium]